MYREKIDIVLSEENIDRLAAYLNEGKENIKDILFNIISQSGKYPAKEFFNKRADTEIDKFLSEYYIFINKGIKAGISFPVSKSKVLILGHFVDWCNEQIKKKE